MSETTDASTRFITVREVAAQLAVSVPTVHVYIRRGIIPAHKFGDVRTLFVTPYRRSRWICRKTACTVGSKMPPTRLMRLWHGDVVRIPRNEFEAWFESTRTDKPATL